MCSFCFRFVRNFFALIGLIVLVWVFFDNKSGNFDITTTLESLNDYGEINSVIPNDNSKLLTDIPKAYDISKPLVILDPGHGGKDGGTVSGDAFEKNLNLQLSKKISSELNRHQISVVMTRGEDKRVGLADRAIIANRYPNAIFISIHHNAATLKSAKGIETYYSDNKPKSLKDEQMNLLKIKKGNSFRDNRSKMLASLLHSSVCESTKASDRGVRERSLAMTRWVSCPSVLIECGFLSNPKEKLDLLSEPYKEALSRGITEGILRYFSAVDKDFYYGIAFDKAPRAIAEL